MLRIFQRNTGAHPARMLAGLAGGLCMLMAGSALAFSLDDVAKRAQELAASRYEEPVSNLPDDFRKMAFADYQRLRFNPEHAYWKESGRVTYTSVSDDEALSAFHTMARTEGILPAIESSHAIAHAATVAANRKSDEVVVVCLSGRGDKDVNEVARLSGLEL